MNQEELNKLLEVSRTMAETRELDPLLKYAMAMALSLIGAERGVLALLDEEGNLDFRIRVDNKGQELENIEQELSFSIINKVLASGEAQVIADAIVDPNFSDATSVRALQLRSVLCAPFIARERVIGCIYVENRSGMGVFSKDDVQLLTYFAGHAAISIENAMLNDELEARVEARTAQLRSANVRLEQSWSEAVEANRMRTVLYSTITHDIRSPLSLVVTALHMLHAGEFGELNPDQAEWIKTSLDAAHHVVRLTDDFFDLTKMEMGKLAVFRDEVRAVEFFQKVYEFGEMLPWPDIVSFRMEVAEDLPEAVQLDATRMQQVILNLISNAHKFTKSGEVVLGVRHNVDERSLDITVSDTGIGIPPEQFATIFDRFQQVGSSEDRKKGTGLGLAICRELVQLHDGQIWVESEMGSGSTFHVRIPIEIPVAETQ